MRKIYSSFYSSLLLFSVLVLIISFSPNDTMGQSKPSIPEDYKIVEDLSGAWEVPGNGSRLKVKEPYKAKVKGLLLNLNQDTGVLFYLKVPEESTLFINDQLKSHYHRGKFLKWEIDSLKEKYGRDSIYVVLSGLGKDIKPKVSYLIEPDSVATTVATGPEILTRDPSNIRDYFIVGILILLGGFAFLWNKHPKQFMGIYGIQGMHTARIRDQRLVNGVNMLFIGQQCLLIALLLLLFQFYGGIFRIPLVLFAFKTLWWFLLTWLLLGLIVFILITIKFLFVQMVAFIFNFKAFGNIHIFEFLRLSLIFFGGLFLIILLAYMGYGNDINLLFNWSITIFYIFAFIRILILTLNLLRGESFRNIYLFSYLCATEIIPLFIGIKIMLG